MTIIKIQCKCKNVRRFSKRDTVRISIGANNFIITEKSFFSTTNREFYGDPLCFRKKKELLLTENKY